MMERELLDAVGWLGSAGYQTIIDKEAQRADLAAKEKIAREHGSNGNNGSVDKKISDK